MPQEWRIRITGKPRKEPNKDLLLQALVALVREQQRANAADQANRDYSESQKGVSRC